MLTYIAMTMNAIRSQIAKIHADERGYTSETVLVTALLVAAAIIVLAIIVAAITKKAQEIQGNM